LAANSIQKAEIQLFFLVFFLVLLDGADLRRSFLLPDFFPGAFAATISYDCRINSFNSSVAQRVQPVQHHPLVSPDVGCGTNILALDQFRERLGRAFEAHPQIVQADDGKNLPAYFLAHLEAERIAPLQLLNRVREGEAVGANGIDVHGY
jgi:hypothetical protein